MAKDLKPYVASNLKSMNRKTVYQLISSTGEISRAEISRKTGISSPTVLKIINYFLEKGLVTEKGEGDSLLGRKPKILKFNPEAAFSIGVEFEGNFLKIGIVDLLGKIKKFKRISVPANFDEIVNNYLVISVNDLIKSVNISKDKILGIGFGIPGVIDTKNYVIEFAPLVGIDNTKECKTIIEEVSDKVGLPIIIENDVKAATMGEFVTRSLGPDDDLVYISLGRGLGAGIILNGKLLKGKRNFAGEIGYMVFDKSYQASKSKSGWLESRINIQALSDKWDIVGLLAQDTKLEDLLSAEDLYSLSDYVASNLALGIANIVTVIDINFVVVGGVVAEVLGDLLVAKIKEYLSKFCLSEIEVQFKKCDEPGVVGAASIVTNKKLDELLID